MNLKFLKFCLFVAASALALAASANVNVTVQFDCLDSVGRGAGGACKPSAARLLNSDGTYKGITYKSGQSTTVSVPEGTYDLYTQFTLTPALRATLGAFEAFVVKENIVISSDTTLTLSFKDAKHRIHFDFMLPTGQKFTPLVTSKTASGTVDTLTASNVRNCVAYISFARDTHAALRKDIYSGFGPCVYTQGTLTTYGGTDILLSDLSSRYVLGMNAEFLLAGDTTGTSVHVAQGLVGCTQDQNLINQNQFVNITDHYLYSPESATADYTGGIDRGSLLLGLGGHTHVIGGTGIGAYAKNAHTSATADRHILVCDELSRDANPGLGVAYTTSVYDWASLNSKTFTYTAFASVSPNYVIADGKAKAAVSPVGNYRYVMIGGTRREVCELNSPFAYFIDQRGTHLLAADVPVISVSTSLNATTKRLASLGTEFVGRYGETRASDRRATHITISSADSVLADGKLASNSYSLTSVAGLNAPVTIVLADSNAVVDGMSGHNITTIKVNPSNADASAPTLQMLQLRNTATGKVTDRFETNSADDVLLVAGGDFTHNPSAKVWTATPATLQVSWSPSGKDQWTALEMAQDADYAQQWGFGSLWRGNLQQVTAQSDNHWYDLKFVLTDAAGNTQQQVLAPAFSIEKVTSSSVTDVKPASGRVVVARYAIDGRPLQQPEPGVNIVRYSDGTAAKVVVR